MMKPDNRVTLSEVSRKAPQILQRGDTIVTSLKKARPLPSTILPDRSNSRSAMGAFG